jgi:hypothetical protein
MSKRHAGKNEKKDEIMNSSDAADVMSWESNNAGRLVIWAIRLWTQGRARNLPVAPALRVAFSRANIPQAVAVFERFMLTMDNGLCRDIRVNRICNNQPTPDEVLLVEILERIQARDCRGARDWMACLFTCEGCQRVYEQLDQLTAMMRDANLMISGADLDCRKNTGKMENPASARLVH